MHNRCASFHRRLPSWLDAPYGMLSLTDHACWRLMRCFQFEPWCIAVKKERLNIFWRTSQPPWTFGPFLSFFCHKLKCLQFATPRFAITHEPSQPKHPYFSRTWVYTHTHTASLAFIRTHTTAAWQLYYMMIRLALSDKVLCLTFKTRVLGKLGSKLFKRTWAKRNCTTRYTLTRTETLKQSLPTESDTRDFRGQCSGEQCYMG